MGFDSAGPALACELQPWGEAAKRRVYTEVSTMLTLLLFVLVLALVFGGVGHSRYGYVGWSPAALVLLVLLVLFLSGHRLAW